MPRARALKASTLALAVAADALFGDPRALPHPVRFIGWFAGRIEKRARYWARGDATRERASGFAIVACVVGGTAGLSTLVLGRMSARNAVRASIVELALASTTIAARDLLCESGRVREALEAHDLARARTCIARILGRDASDLDETEIARATIETLAKNLCDGIVGPLVALTLGGVPAALALRAARTLDAMLGHREAPYAHLGFASAMLDDTLCWIPARLSALAIVLVAPIERGGVRRAHAILLADGARHASPNAGRPGAAMAGALGVRLGGVERYGNIPVEGPDIGVEFGPPQASDVWRAEQITIAAASLCAFASVAIRTLVDRK